MDEYEQRVASLYDRLASDYLKRIRGRQSYWDVVRGALRPITEGALLDVGCGPGHLTADLPPAVQVYGIDSSSAMIAAAAQARAAGTYAVRSFNADLPEGWPRFDVILAAGCIEFCEDLAGLLARLCAALGPDGWILATVPEEKDAHAGRTTQPLDPDISIYQYSFLATAEAIAAAGLAPSAYAHIPGWVAVDGVRFQYGLWTLRPR